jgi:type 1 glutamine amidotransferase
VFFHHSVASWCHTWPQYVEAIGAAADWGMALKNIRGKDYPISGFRGGQQQHITIVDKTHPIVQGLGDGFDITDETYLCPMFEDSVHCLARTSAVPTKENFPMQMQRFQNWNHPPGSNMVAWVKTAEKSPVAYIQHGHDHVAWENPAFRTLLMNAIRWAASPEAMKWAAANPKKTFT